MVTVTALALPSQSLLAHIVGAQEAEEILWAREQERRSLKHAD